MITVKNQLAHRSNTYCHLLWDSVFIDPKGDVYICCRVKPGEIGNIYRHDLFNIWTKIIRLKIFRQMSLNKCLYCYHGCNLSSSAEKEGINRYPRFMKYPNRISILYGETCTLRCIMCRQDHRSKITIDNNILKKNIDWRQIEKLDFKAEKSLSWKMQKSYIFG